MCYNGFPYSAMLLHKELTRNSYKAQNKDFLAINNELCKKGLCFVTGIACQGKPQVHFLVLVLIFAYYSGQGSLKQTCFCFRSYTKNLAITLEETNGPLVQHLCVLMIKFCF